jgi:hypothetical protein
MGINGSASLTLGLLLWAGPQPEGPPRNVVGLRTAIADPAAVDWEIGAATISDNFQQLTVLIRLRNISNHEIRGAKFYAEFLDARQRRCFTLPFNLTFNREHLRTPIAQGDTRTVASGANGLGFAARPDTVWIHLVEQENGDGTKTSGMGASRFRIPVTIPGGTPRNWELLGLNPKLIEHTRGVEDLVLADVDVDAAGKLKQFRIIRAADDRLRDWSSEAMRTLPFIPAGEASMPTESRTLVFIRAFDQEAVGFGKSSFVARDSPWMREYIAGLGESDVPPVNEVLFEPAGVWSGRKLPGKGLFEYGWVGSDWSSSIYTWLNLGTGGCCQAGWKSIADR